MSASIPGSPHVTLNAELQKLSGSFFKRWLPRRFVLTPTHLHYYSPDGRFPRDVPTHSFALADGITVDFPSEEFRGEPHVLDLTFPSRRLFIAYPTRSAFSSWLQVLRPFDTTTMATLAPNSSLQTRSSSMVAASVAARPATRRSSTTPLSSAAGGQRLSVRQDQLAALQAQQDSAISHAISEAAAGRNVLSEATVEKLESAGLLQIARGAAYSATASALFAARGQATDAMSAYSFREAKAALQRRAPGWLPEGFSADPVTGFACDETFKPDMSAINSDESSTPLASAHRVKQWLRPAQLLAARGDTRPPLLFEDDAGSGDAEQGSVGDCWLISSISVVASYPELIKRVFVHCDPARGFYIVRIFANCRWTDISIDDRIPCDSKGRTIFAGVVGREFWVALLEKAFAKYTGSYQSLSGGHERDGLVDLTGGVSESVQLNAKLVEAQVAELCAAAEAEERDPTTVDPAAVLQNQIWDQYVLHANVGRMLLGASADKASAGVEEAAEGMFGVLNRHAYSILGGVQIGEHRLVRLRNPWAHGEYTGPWGDSDPRWTPSLLKQARHTATSEDGIFFVPLDRFVDIFDRLDVCHLASPDAKYRVIAGRWEGSSAAGARKAENPKFLLKLSTPSLVTIALMQADPRVEGDANTEMFSIGMHVFEAEGPAGFKKSTTRLATPTWRYHRECSVRGELPAGTFTVLPSTFKPNLEGNFAVRVYVEGGDFTLTSFSETN
jgi:hypothetical protein